jgi:hypothetical protein
MRQLIRHILNESTAKTNILNVIKDEDIFVAAKFVGGMENLKNLLKDEPEIVSLIDSLKGKLNLIYHSKKEYVEFPMEFEIVGKGGNIWNTNSWPIVNLIYNDSMFTDSEKELFNSFVFDAINDLNIGNVYINPKADKMFRDSSYYDIKFVNGQSYKDIEYEDYDDDDINYLNRQYRINMNLKENKTIKENKEDPTQKILNFLLRRYKIDEVDLGWADHSIKLKMIKFDIDGERYSISTFENKRQQIAKILDILTTHNVIDNIDSNDRKLDTYTQKVIRAIKQFINQVMDNKSNMNESEITERCWKGYTQKGMKTMFGKEYPNCVKIKKKKSVRETIKDMLDEEVTKKYSKPTEKVEQLVYRWLNDYFDGAQMYHNKSWESTHSFEFCNNGKEILDVTLYFHNDDNVYDDKRKTEERDFEKGYLMLPKNIMEELSFDIPVRISYLKYIFEEWFDDTYLGEIQKFMDRNDIYISEFDITSRNAEICVPPVTKPEDVTEEDMIEYILQTTLYSRDKILKYENEEPGFIEKTYLGKLRDAEINRLR